ncbi:MAG: Hsp33 family molecular chaperone HslO [Candidatus Wallacebacter cryptica]|nr:Hsp33 family molecular chaperone HslO [Bacillota bacterium]
MSDQLIRCLAFDKQVRVIFVDNTMLVQERCNPLETSKLTKTALAKTLTIASLISGTLKDTQRISLRVAATDQEYQVLAEADAEGSVRGFVSQPFLNLEPGRVEGMTLPEFFGDRGGLQVIKDLGRYGKMFTGVTKMPYGNIVDDFSYYFEQSEQTTSMFYLSLIFDDQDQITLSRGMFAQLMPGGSEEQMQKLTDAVKVSSLFQPQTNFGEVFQEEPESISAVFQADLEVLSIEPIQFRCSCSKELLLSILSSLTEEEIQSYIESGEDIEVICNMCGEKHYIDPHEVVPKS